MSETNLDLYSLSKCPVRDEKNAVVELGSLWRESKAVLVFLRHFACIACRAHAADVWQHRKVFEENNSKIVFIGNGAPQYIDGFRQELNLEGATIYTDPTLEVFRFAGLRRKLLDLVSVSSAVNALKLHGAGHRQKSPLAQGDHLQLGGVLVITPDNKVMYHYVSKALGDVPETEEVAQK